MRDSARTIFSRNQTDRAEIVRAHEIPHDTLKKRQFSQQNQRRAPARFFAQNSMCEGGFIPSHTVVRANLFPMYARPHETAATTSGARMRNCMSYNLPALNWLAKRDPDAALAILHRLRDETCHCGVDADVANFDPRDRNPDDAETHDAPDLPLTSETMAEPIQDGPDEAHPEMLHEIKPDLHGMLRSAGGVAMPWCGERWRYKRSGKVVWRGEPWAYLWCCEPHVPERHVVTIGGLTFYTRPKARRGHEGGMLLSYVDDGGKVQQPAYKAIKPRGGKRPLRDNPAGYLALPGATPSPLHAEPYRRPFSGEPTLPPMYDPQSGVEANRAVLRSFGVDGSVPFEDLPFPATRCPTAIAKGAQFIGGISGRSQTASTATIGKVEEQEPLDQKTATVVEEVGSRGTLERIGLKLGYRGGYADRAGKREIGRAHV